MSRFNELFPGWTPRVDHCTDIISPVLVERLAATLDEAAPDYRNGDKLPPLWHWVFFIKSVPHVRLGRDGHPQRGDFLPPVSLPRRMSAGTKTQFLQPLIIGLEAIRESEVIDITEKSGVSGALLFVRVENRISQQKRLCIVEQQDIVYREMGTPMVLPEAKPLPKPVASSWSLDMTVDATMLFRFSAVTFNGHRIHYDRTYTVTEEGYPALVVHAPLLAMLLLQLVRRNTDKRINRFEYRSLVPLFDGQPFQLSAVEDGTDTINMQVLRADGKTAAQARCVTVVASDDGLDCSGKPL